jgi:hypothetical protein
MPVSLSLVEVFGLEVTPGPGEPEGSSPTPVFAHIVSKFHTALKDPASGIDLLTLARAIRVSCRTGAVRACRRPGARRMVRRAITEICRAKVRMAASPLFRCGRPLVYPSPASRLAAETSKSKMRANSRKFLWELVFGRFMTKIGTPCGSRCRIPQNPGTLPGAGPFVGGRPAGRPWRGRRRGGPGCKDRPSRARDADFPTCNPLATSSGDRDGSPAGIF